MGSAGLRKIQYGPESVHGTAVAATKMLPIALAGISPDRKPTFPRESAGVLADAVRSYISGRMVNDTLKFDSVYYQTLPMLLSCSIKGGITPAEQTVDQDDYLWAFTPVLNGSASNNQDSITLERGDDDFMVETEYVQFTRLKIAGEVNQEGGDSTIKIDADYYGRQNSVTSFTVLSPQASLIPVSAKLCKLYIDPSWAAVGSTEKTNTLRAFDIEIISGLHAKSHGSGNEFFDEHGEGNMAFMAAFTFEGNSNMSDIYTDFLSQALKVVRLKMTGPQIGTGDNYLFQLDLGGKWDEPVALSGESNGNNLWTAILHGIYDVTGGKLLGINVITNHNTI
jgi:hypothetical protein